MTKKETKNQRNTSAEWFSSDVFELKYFSMSEILFERSFFRENKNNQ